MREHTVTVREGEACGPIDWEHPKAAGMPDYWREAETHPDRFTFNGRAIVQICMYDGWPYWEPRPAIQFIGPLQSGEWKFFDSYSVWPGSIMRK